MKNNYLCLGEHCPVRNTCLRYTDTKRMTRGKAIRNCTNQKGFIQDEDAVVKGR